MKQFPEIQNYLSKFLLPLPGDYPTFYFIKKIIAKLDCSDPRYSIIPIQGPLHVFLNFCEDTVTIFHPLFAKLYEHIFNGKLAQKPRPHRIVLCIVSAYLGWCKIREEVLPKFSLCKDVATDCLLYLLEVVLPLAYFTYSWAFRGGRLAEFRLMMKQMAVVFITFRRTHYNKTTLSSISDDIHHQNNDALESFKTSHLMTLSEKLIELFHSALRRSISPLSTAKQIEETARQLMSHSGISELTEQYLPSYKRGTSHKNLELIATRSANFWTDAFDNVQDRLGESHMVMTKT